MRTFNPKDVIIDVRSWYQAATEKRELLAMDDRMLRDIGITRVDADRLANQPLPPSSGSSGVRHPTLCGSMLP
jgi:uncharacterized protein YjiS (DUF1127 family)